MQYSTNRVIERHDWWISFRKLNINIRMVLKWW